MATWRGKCAGHEVWINDVDHLDAHCHVILEGRNKAVDLYTLRIRNPPPNELPAKLRRALKELQPQLLQAWDRVKVVPKGSNTQAW